jgi:hypothetical protein
MPRKAFHQKTCAYCRAEGSSSTADHVIPRKAMFVKDRANLPQVPACARCNNEKSRLENYFLALVLAGSNHPDGDRYREEFIKPRLRKNRRFAHAIASARPIVRPNNGRFEQAYAVNISADETTALMEMIALGLYYHHTGGPLDPTYRAMARIFAPEHERELVDGVLEFFPADSPVVGSNFGNGAFTYEGFLNNHLPGFSLWRMMWHGGIPLAGENGPRGGVSTWMVSTAPPDEDAVENLDP